MPCFQFCGLLSPSQLLLPPPFLISPPPTLSPSPHPYFSFPLYSSVCTCVCMCVAFSDHPSCVLRQVLSLACNVPCRPGRLSGLSQGSVCLCLSSTAITSASPTPCFLFSPWLPGWNLGPLVCRTGTLPTELSFQASLCLSAYHGVCLALSLSEAHLQTSFQVSPSSCAVWWPAGSSS